VAEGIFAFFLKSGFLAVLLLRLEPAIEGSA
jgi:cytochrome bd-type quinol oxidase subunit 1